VEPPEIRYHRFEQSIAIRWADDQHWYRIDPDTMIHGDLGDRCRVMPTAFDDDREAAADGWINPLLDHRPDITRLTAPVRDHLDHPPARHRRNPPLDRLSSLGVIGHVAKPRPEALCDTLTVERVSENR